MSKSMRARSLDCLGVRADGAALCLDGNRVSAPESKLRGAFQLLAWLPAASVEPAGRPVRILLGEEDSGKKRWDN